jgi:hypothetical protein
MDHVRVSESTLAVSVLTIAVRSIEGKLERICEKYGLEAESRMIFPKDKLSIGMAVYLKVPKDYERKLCVGIEELGEELSLLIGKQVKELEDLKKRFTQKKVK